ncbi:TolC family outer membrane protein [Aestuariicella hydrocarbonica]|uniref:TolC family outer membrane protein n=1 Tax=Pseudomaricurvus hydrocarbonicus TaxID=1470433 RepID=A0A9E5JVF1_9GAMM|nr:TolC family outer membrane protein [Aestuariicella hydrocarbonica]NHO66313.1 TolC family outer membrane protein [Aestuariicella hydrocarbonica]
MKNYITGAGVALLWLASVPSLASEGLLDILSQAKTADPSFRGAAFERAAEQEAVKQARARLLPSLSFNAERTDNSDAIVESENQVANASSADYETTTYALTLNQSIYNHEYWVRYSQSKVVRDRADVEFDRARQDLLINVAERYFTVLKTEEQLSAISAEKEALQRHVEYASKSRNAGLGRRAEVVDAEARYYTALAEEAQFSKGLDDALFSLMQLTGQLHEELRPMQEKLPLELPDPAMPQPWIERGVTGNPDILSQQFTLQEARMEVKAQTAGHYPTLSLVYRNFDEDQGGSLFGGTSRIEGDEIALQLEVPIYQGGAVSSRRREAIERMHKSQEDLTRVLREVKTDVNSAFQGVMANIAQVKALQKTVSSQREVLRNKEKGLQAGLYTMLVVLDAQRDLADAQKNYIEARYDYAINSLKLKRAAGVLVEGDLVAINNWLR